MAKYDEIVIMKNINDYIKREHPMYYRELTVGKKMQNVEFISFVNAIFRVLKSTSKDDRVIFDGKIYQQIDKLFNNYVSSNFSEEERNEVDNKFNSFCDYVKTAIKEDGQIDDEQYLDKISWYVAGLVVQNFDCKKRPFFNAKNMIIDCYKIIDKSIKNYQKIDEIISSSEEALKKKTGFDQKTLDKMYCDISVDIYKRNISEDMVNEFVVDQFIKRADYITKCVEKRIKKVISLMDDPFTISDNKVVFEISFEATLSGEICAIDLINGDLDDHIREVAEKYRTKKIPDYKVVQHIYEILKSEADYDITDTVLRNYARDDVFIKLKNENGYHNRDIVLGDADDLIRQMYLDRFHKHNIPSVQRMKGQSVKQPKTQNYKPVDYVKRNRIKKKIQQETAKLLIALVIGGALGVAGGLYINRRDDNEAISIVQSIDETDYKVNRKDNETKEKSLDEIADGIIDYYNDIKSYGDKYSPLIFDNAYKSGLSMTDMDTVLFKVRYESSLSDGNRNLYESLYGHRCYYEYVYDVLLDNGFFELLDDKYVSAIISYKQSFYGHSYGIPSDKNVHSEDESSLEHMMKLYEDYCKKMQIELGNKIQNVENDDIKSEGIGR